MSAKFSKRNSWLNCSTICKSIEGHVCLFRESLEGACLGKCDLFNFFFLSYRSERKPKCINITIKHYIKISLLQMKTQVLFSCFFPAYFHLCLLLRRLSPAHSESGDFVCTARV